MNLKEARSEQVIDSWLSHITDLFTINANKFDGFIG